MNNLVDGFLENQNTETTDSKTDSETTDSETTDNKDDSTTENIPSSLPHKLVFAWEGDFYYVYVASSNDNHVLVGASTDKLKPNTEYEVKWSIDPFLLTDTPARFAEDTYNGKETYKIFFDTAYEAYTSLWSQPYYRDNLSAVLSNKITFTSGSEGDVFFIGLFLLDYVTQEDLDYNIGVVFDYIKYIEITEVIK